MNDPEVVASLWTVYLLQMLLKKINIIITLSLIRLLGLEHLAFNLESQNPSAVDSIKLPLQLRFKEPYSLHQFGAASLKNLKLQGRI